MASSCCSNSCLLFVRRSWKEMWNVNDSVTDAIDAKDGNLQFQNCTNSLILINWPWAGRWWGLFAWKCHFWRYWRDSQSRLSCWKSEVSPPETPESTPSRFDPIAQGASRWLTRGKGFVAGKKGGFKMRLSKIKNNWKKKPKYLRSRRGFRGLDVRKETNTCRLTYKLTSSLLTHLSHVGSWSSMPG